MSDDNASLVMEITEKIEEAQSATRWEAGKAGEIAYESGGVRIKKPRSMVNYGGKEIAPRVAVYDKLGRQSMVPTAALAYHLNKTDHEGNRVFFSKPPEGIEPPTPIDQTCDVCLPRGVRKKFYSEFDYIGHMESFHPREFRILEERRKEGGASMMAAILGMSASERKAVQTLLAGDEVKGVACADCDYVGAHNGALALHRRAKHGEP
jgi:hypothetical protein